MTKIQAFLLAGLVALLGGCDSQSRKSGEPSASSNTVHSCESGAIVKASYPFNETATVQYQGKTYSMQLAVSADGARYTGEQLEWWVRAGEGTLSHLLADGTSGDIMESCTRSTN